MTIIYTSKACLSIRPGCWEIVESVSMNLTLKDGVLFLISGFIVVGFFDTVILYLKQCIYFGVFTVKNLCFNPFDQKFYLKSKNNLMG